MAERDAVIDALADLGRAVPASTADLQRGTATLAAFRSAQRRRARVRTVSVVAFATAAAVVLTWFVVPLLRARGFTVENGGFLVQQGRVDAGATVAAGEWIEPDRARACLRVAARRVCGDPGARLRIIDDATIELAQGRVTADGALRVITPIGAVFGHDGGVDLTLADDASGLTVAGAAVTLSRDGATTELGAGTHAARVPELVARAEPVPTEPTAAPAVPDTITITEPTTERAASRPARPAPRVTTESAGDMLAAARELAGRGKLAQAATAYQRLLDAFPDSGESRAALVSLGRVQASRGRHAAALAAFSRYLDAGGGPLAEEAHFGRIGSLHALGRAADRDRAIAALEAAHPRSVYLPKARALP